MIKIIESLHLGGSHMTQAPQPSKPVVRRRKKKGSFKKIFLRVFLLIFALGVAFSLALLFYLIRSLPPWEPEKLTGANSTLIYDIDGDAAITLHAGENRIDVDLNQIPQDMINAFLATEDRKFYQHHGISLKGMARSLVANFTSGEMTQGASTITQQLARQSFLTLEKSWIRKSKEILISFRIEANFSKDEILNMYLNKIPFGAGAYGAQAAAHIYFDKDISELNLAECSLLAGLVQYPSGYNPFFNFDAAKKRHRVVLNNMVEMGFIIQAQADQAHAEELVLTSGTTGTVPTRYGYYRDAVIDEAVKVLSENKIENPENAIYTGGLRIYTNLNPNVQLQMEADYADAANFPNQTQNDKPVESAMVVIENNTGGITALVGGREYTVQRGFNRATSAYRQPGSSIKPITVYSPALELGHMPFKVLDDSPISYQTGGGVWNPKNYDLRYRGLINMRTAVQNSVNTYAVQLLDEIGVRTAFDYGIAFGLSLTDQPGNNDLSLAPLSLGGLTYGVTPVEMASAYATIANQGIHIEPHLINKIEVYDGTILYEFKPVYTRVIREDSAWLMTSMLQTVVQSGTGTRAAISGVPVGGKTGTTDELTNAWFCGITPVYSAAVWMGYDDQNKPMYNVYGGDFAARLFKNSIQKAHEGISPGSFVIPENIVTVTVCSKDGKLPDVLTPVENRVSEFSTKEAAPSDYSSIYKSTAICSESQLLANGYCPEHVVQIMLDLPGSSHEPNKIPSEICQIHDANTEDPFFFPELRDPNHGNDLHDPDDFYDPDDVFDLNDIKI